MNSIKFLFIRLLTQACLLFFTFTMASAQGQIKEDYQLETLTVTAEKREKNIQDVPMSITAFSEMDLEDAGINDTNELLRFAPNVYLREDANQNFIVIRGVTNFYGAKLSPVGFFVDGASFPLNGMHDIDLMDIKRIEILKGPQGTLYGKNSEAGVINIITKPPGNKTEAKVFGEYSFFDTEHGNSPGYKLGASIKSPLVKDKLFMGLTGQWKDYKGFMKNEFNGDDEAGRMEQINGRANLRWTPKDQWEISFIADISDFDGGMSDYRYITGPFNIGRQRVSYDSPLNEWKQDGNGQTLNAGYKGKGFNLNSVTSRRYYKNTSASDFDCTSFDSPWAGNGFFKDQDTTYSQELRISSPEGNKDTEWLAGVYLFDEETDIFIHSQRKMESKRDSSVDTTGYALFGQFSYTLVENLHLTAGLRLDYVELNGSQTRTAMGNTTSYGKELSYDEILPKVSIAWDFTDGIMAYATIAKGYLHGGYNYSKATSLDNLTYDAEYTLNYEVGAKTVWFDKRLSANIAAFYIEMKDKQVAEWSEDKGSPVQEIQNAADAHSMGMELELHARPFKGLDLFGDFGFTKSEIDHWVATEYSMMTSDYFLYDYKNKKLPNVPEYTYSLGIQYRHPTGFFGRTDLIGTGEFYSDSKNNAMEKAYKLVNLRAGYEGENYDIIFWCKNLLDEEYNKVRLAVGKDQMGIDGEPRMAGVTIRYRY